jgi:hypothetical protein
LIFGARIFIFVFGFFVLGFFEYFVELNFGLILVFMIFGSLSGHADFLGGI